MSSAPDQAEVRTIDPATGGPIARYAFADATEVEATLARASAAFDGWGNRPFADRREMLARLERALSERGDELARMITREMGKSAAEARAEIQKSIASVRQLGELFPIWRTERESAPAAGYTLHLRPLGVVLGIMPWNFPSWQVVRFAVPALLAGNTVVLKHAPNVWGSAALIADVFNAAFPPGCYQDLRTNVPDTERVIADPRVRGISLTGSGRAGMRVGELCGRALKPCVLELGGSDAYIILSDADVAAAAKICARSRVMNAGQSCVSAKRFIVVDDVAGAFTAALIAEMRAVGRVALLARADLREQLADQVRRSVAAGATVAFGGTPDSGPGFYYPPTVLVDVRPGQPAFDEELFGPVAAVIRAPGEDAAFELANLSIFGLGGALFSRDLARARRLAIERLECGVAFVNEMVRSEVSVPFGGVKASGFGRELGRDGAFAFTNLKTVFVP